MAILLWLILPLSGAKPVPRRVHHCSSMAVVGHCTPLLLMLVLELLLMCSKLGRCGAAREHALVPPFLHFRPHSLLILLLVVFCSFPVMAPTLGLKLGLLLSLVLHFLGVNSLIVDVIVAA